MVLIFNLKKKKILRSNKRIVSRRIHRLTKRTSQKAPNFQTNGGNITLGDRTTGLSSQGFPWPEKKWDILFLHNGKTSRKNSKALNNQLSKISRDTDSFLSGGYYMKENMINFFFQLANGGNSCLRI